MILTVYVPHDNELVNIKPGSAIAGRPWEHDSSRIEVCYEGNVYGHMKDFGEMIFHAAGRLVENAPTVARMVVSPAALQPVGTYDTATRELTIMDDVTFDDWRSRADA